MTRPKTLFYLGTRGCRTLLREVLRDHVGPVRLLVPTDPALFGPLTAVMDQEDLDLLADALSRTGRTKVEEAVAGARDALAQVFEGQGETEPPAIEVHRVPAPLAEHLPPLALEAEKGKLWVSRDALDVLDRAGITLAAAMDQADADLEAR